MTHLTASIFDFSNHCKRKNIDIKGKTLLDVGCRDHGSKAAFDTMEMLWTGCDVKPDHPKGSIVECDMTELTFPDESFDFLFVCHSLEHCENPLLALREFRRVVKTGGYVFISLPCPCMHHILQSDNDHIFCFNDM